MKKTLLLFIAVAACFLPAFSVSYDMLQVNVSNGSTVDIVMTDKLKISFDRNNMIVTGTTADVNIAKNDIVNIVHKNTSHVEGIVNDPDFEFNNGLIFHNLPAGSQIVVSDISGKVEASVVAEGEFILSADELTPGVHIVSVNGKSYKIFKK